MSISSLSSPVNFEASQIIVKFDKNVSAMESWAGNYGTDENIIPKLKDKVCKRMMEIVPCMDSLNKNIDAKKEIHKKMLDINKRIAKISQTDLHDSVEVKSGKVTIQQMCATIMNMLNPDSVPDVVKNHIAYQGDVLRMCLVKLFKSSQFTPQTFPGTQQFASRYCLGILKRAWYQDNLKHGYNARFYLLRDSSTQQSGEQQVVTMSYYDSGRHLIVNHRLFYDQGKKVWQYPSKDSLQADSLDGLIVQMAKKMLISLLPCKIMKGPEISAYVTNYGVD